MGSKQGASNADYFRMPATYPKLTQWSSLLEKLLVAQLATTFFTFYGTSRFIIVFGSPPVVLS